MPSGRGRLPPVLLRTLTADSVSSLTDDRRPTDASVFAAFTAVSVDENVRGVDGVASASPSETASETSPAPAPFSAERVGLVGGTTCVPTSWLPPFERSGSVLPPFDGVRSAKRTVAPVEQSRDESGSGGTGVDRRWNLGAADDAAAAPSAGAAEEASIIASHEGGRQGSRAGRPHVTTFEIL